MTDIVAIDHSLLTPGAILREVPGRGVVVVSGKDETLVAEGAGLEQVASALREAGVPFLNEGYRLRLPEEATATS